MGVWFDDPDIELEDIFWYNLLGMEIELAWGRNQELVSIDEEYNTKSCYVELHRNGDLFLYKVIWMELIIQNS